MSNVISRKKLLTACIDAIVEAEELYSSWTPDGIAMRYAPESFVQSIVAKKLAENGVKLRLEASVRDLVADQSCELPRNNRGRIDIAVYYKSKTPRLLIEIKKVTEHQSLNDDYERIRDLLYLCPSIQNGVMIGYTTAINSETVDKRLNKVKEKTGAHIVRRLKPRLVTGKKGGDRYLVSCLVSCFH